MRVVNCSEPERFQPIGYWASQGLDTEEEVRWEMLWQAATADTDVARQARDHAEDCDYCGDVLDRFRRISHAMKPGQKIDLAICPSAEELFDFLHNNLSPEVHQKVSVHSQQCRHCAGELKWLASSEKSSQRPLMMTPRARQISLLAAAAVLVLGAVLFITVQKHSGYTPIEDHVYSSKYSDLAKMPLLDRTDLTKAAPPSHWAQLDKAMSALELGDNRRAVGLSARLVNDKDEPAAEYVLGRALLQEKMISAANEAMLKSERMSPMSAFRCWTALQMGLFLGDKEVIMRECKHLENDAAYAESVRNIREEVNKRG